MSPLSPTRALGVSLAGCALFAAANAIWLQLAWTPRLATDALRVSVVVAVLLSGVWVRTARPAVAVAGTFLTSLAISFAYVAAFLLPNASRTAWCSAPDTYCEDGMLVLIVPVVGMLLGVVAAVVAGGLAALARRHAHPSDSFRSLSSR